MKNKKRTQKFHGFPLMGVSKAMGLPYVTVWRHANGERRVSAEAAILYEEKLGIPRHELRPDLWPQPVTVKQPQPREA